MVIKARKSLKRKKKWYELRFIQRILVSTNRHSVSIRGRGALAAIRRAAQLLVGVGIVQVGAWIRGGKLEVGRVDVRASVEGERLVGLVHARALIEGEWMVGLLHVHIRAEGNRLVVL